MLRCTSWEHQLLAALLNQTVLAETIQQVLAEYIADGVLRSPGALRSTSVEQRNWLSKRKSFVTLDSTDLKSAGNAPVQAALLTAHWRQRHRTQLFQDVQVERTLLSVSSLVGGDVGQTIFSRSVQLTRSEVILRCDLNRFQVIDELWLVELDEGLVGFRESPNVARAVQKFWWFLIVCQDFALRGSGKVSKKLKFSVRHKATYSRLQSIQVDRLSGHSAMVG